MADGEVKLPFPEVGKSTDDHDFDSDSDNSLSLPTPKQSGATRDLFADSGGAFMIPYTYRSTSIDGLLAS